MQLQLDRFIARHRLQIKNVFVSISCPSASPSPVPYSRPKFIYSILKQREIFLAFALRVSAVTFPEIAVVVAVVMCIHLHAI